MKAKVTYRGWPGHFICGDRCVFHLNTLIELGEVRVVVSTAGKMKKHLTEEGFDTIGHNRYYETMVFHAEKREEFWDMDVNREVGFDSEWAYSNIDDEWKANKGHIAVVNELVQKVEQGKLEEVRE